MNLLKSLFVWTGWIIWRSLYIFPILCLLGPIFMVILCYSLFVYFDIRPFGINMEQVMILKKPTALIIGMIGGGIGCLAYIIGICATPFYFAGTNYRIAIEQVQKIGQQKPELAPSMDLLIGQAKMQKNSKRLVEWMKKQEELEASEESLKRLKEELPRAISKPAQLEAKIKKITEEIKALRSELLTV